jgi:hypothetical protein
MANTYKLIASVSVGSGGISALSFYDIPATYTDLLMRVSARTNQASVFSTGVFFLNTDTTAGSFRNLAGDGGSAFSSSGSGYIDGTYFPGASATSSTFGNVDFYIPNYASTTTAKSISVDGVTENNATTAYINARAILWNNTAAVVNLSINGGSGNFVQHSTAYLYGISKS